MDAEDLSEAQCSELTEDLRSLITDIGAQIEAGKDSAKPVVLDQSRVGRISRIDAIQSQQLAKASQRNLELRLKQVHQALRNAERDEYGYCRRCEEPIGYQRLKAKPETPFCLRCQGASEKR